MSFDMRATCQCNKWEGNHYTGVVCDVCGHTVSPVYCKDISYKGWIILPKMFPKLIHPLFFEMVTKILNYLPAEMRRYEGRTLTIADWLLNPALPIQKFWPQMGNGLTYLNAHLMDVVKFLIPLQPKKKRETIIVGLNTLLEEYKDNLFIDKYPVINEFLHLMTQYNENSSKFQTDDTSPYLFEIYSALCSIVEDDNMGKRLTTKIVDRRFAKIQMKLIEYAKSLISDKAATKGGLIRKSVISGRLHFTGRGVIVPLTCDNYGDEIHVPWEIMCTSFRSYMVNYLRRVKKYKPMAALRKAIAATYNPEDPEIEEFFDYLMRMYREVYKVKGISTVVNRNPSVQQGACWLGFCTKITKDKTIYVSTMNIYAMNADFDFQAIISLSKYSFWGISGGDPRVLNISNLQFDVKLRKETRTSLTQRKLERKVITNKITTRRA